MKELQYSKYWSEISNRESTVATFHSGIRLDSTPSKNDIEEDPSLEEFWYTRGDEFLIWDTYSVDQDDYLHKEPPKDDKLGFIRHTSRDVPDDTKFAVEFHRDGKLKHIFYVESESELQTMFDTEQLAEELAKKEEEKKKEKDNSEKEVEKDKKDSKEEAEEEAEEETDIQDDTDDTDKDGILSRFF